MRALCTSSTVVTLALLLAGCAASPPPQSPAAPAAKPAPAAEPEASFSDTLGSAPSSSGAMYRYRFRQTDPASDRFTFQDRDLSFFFRPAPDALQFQVENRQDRPVSIDWDRCEFISPDGNRTKVAHSTTRWADRFSVQSATQILGLQRAGDELLPLDYLLDPGTSTDQLHRPLFPEDTTAPQYNGRDFGVDLVFRIENQPRTYSFRFRVLSVLPR